LESQFLFVRNSGNRIEIDLQTVTLYVLNVRTSFLDIGRDKNKHTYKQKTL